MELSQNMLISLGAVIFILIMLCYFGYFCPSSPQVPVITTVTDISSGFTISSTGVPSGGSINGGGGRQPMNVLIGQAWGPTNAINPNVAVLQYTFNIPVTISKFNYQALGDTTHDATSVTISVTNGTATPTVLLTANATSTPPLNIGNAKLQTFALPSTVINPGTSVLVTLNKTTQWQMVPILMNFQ